METTITLERVVESGILGEYDVSSSILHMGVAKAGGEWFKDEKSGKAYRVDENEDGELVVAQAHESKIPVGKAKQVAIVCVDCGEERMVASQDAFQVKRCTDCQKVYRNNKRKERAKVRRTEKRQTKELAYLNEEKEESTETTE